MLILGNYIKGTENNMSQFIPCKGVNLTSVWPPVKRLRFRIKPSELL
jgi:hypothetical protein